MSNQKQFYNLVIPSVGAMLVSALYIVVDGIFVGQGVGVEGLAAVNIASPFLTIMTAITMMVTMGGSTITAIRFGKQDIPGANRSFIASIQIVAAFALFMAVCSLLFSKQISHFLGASNLLLEDTATYLKYYVVFSVFFCGAMVLSAFVRNDGNPQLAFWGMVVGAVSNIFLDWLFIFPLQMGVKGAAIASGLGQVMSCSLLVTHFIRKKGNLFFCFKMDEKGLYREIITRGLPEFITQMGQPVTILCYNLIVIKAFGEIGVSAFSVVNYLVVITLAIFIGVSQGVQPLISRSFGEDNLENQQYYFKKGVKVNVLLAFIVNITMFLFGKWVIAIFNSDTQLIEIAKECMNIYSISFLFAAVNILFTTYFLATKHTRQAMVIAVLRSFICNTVCIFLLPVIFGENAIWTGIIMAEAIVMAVAVFTKHRLAS